ncbi:HAD-IIB family hydrolase [Streptomyces acidiscabies]|uniref:HAD-IIB family hydrolase n=1 Tax=Streptomyces acidiscabies TaxID=42234 RepID=A0AAP6BI01_9ACTN|nr:HAD-IIB family hydrolase [Streptomyces acidiscabies]MBZ3910356.1 HAD-IIB family hydrolase [Streptomyces acidiscabies]MDX2964960.1 HAD-IIB family hydrolase [Streptomyces acidiscabies]MDX3024641.1 HAD-IIB family hydrolase [Streptomyces acidiscabies]MDX3796686.1 HAD-IIB family hydrolase [Streptomyces acidiscabies]GAQ57877.1 Haloacid dehalogenase-like hydrolase [Streptomyces acidiscabies]
MVPSTRIVVFDLDDTLALSKAKITPTMARCLTRLLAEKPVCIISGGRYEQFRTQVLDELPLTPELAERLHLMPTCGTRYLRWESGQWRNVYAENLTEDEKALIVRVLTEGAKSLGLWAENTWGDIIEDRDSQITFSALGQQAPHQEKAAWDPTGARRRALWEYASERLPGLEVRSGGSTSIDVTKKGIDKAYGMQRLLDHLGLVKEDVLFVGDRLDEGGNDYPVRAMGVPCVAVTGWEQTVDVIGTILGDDLDRPAPALLAPLGVR